MYELEDNPIVADVTSNSAQLTWKCGENECQLVVLVREDDDEDYQVHSLVDLSGVHKKENNVQKITVSGLKPGTRYSFKLQPLKVLPASPSSPIIETLSGSDKQKSSDDDELDEREDEDGQGVRKLRFLNGFSQ